MMNRLSAVLGLMGAVSVLWPAAGFPQTPEPSANPATDAASVASADSPGQTEGLVHAAEQTIDPSALQSQPQVLQAAVETSDGASAVSGDSSTQVTTSDSGTDSQIIHPHSLGISYYGIFYGPSVKDGGKYQPTISGDPDPTRPVLLKNFLTAAYAFNDQYGISGTGYFAMTPVKGDVFEFRDPYVRVYDTSIFNAGPFNLYGDFRVHFPISSSSRDMDMRSSLQTFDVLTYTPDANRFSAGLYMSARYFLYGKQGYGDDVEFYLGPNVAYQLAPSFSLTALYEMGASHALYDRPLSLYNDGTDLEPGFSWDITPKVNVNPYLNLTTGGKVTWKSTSVGMTLLVRML